MRAEVNAEVNQFPSLTWHHLHINHGTAKGFMADALSIHVDEAPSLPEGVSFRAIPAGERYDAGNEAETQLGKQMDTLIDTALSDGGGTVGRYTVAEGAAAKSVRVTLRLPAAVHGVSDTEIVAGENSSSCFIFDFSAEDGCTDAFFAHRIRVYAAAGATVHVVTVNRLPAGMTLCNGVGTRAADNATVELTQIELCAGKTFSGARNELSGFRARAVTRSAWLVRESGEADINYISRHVGRETESAGTFSGVVTDAAKKTWRGTIDFPKGCVDARGQEQEDVLLLSPDVENKSMPVILCEEEAVEGHHGSSIGKLSPDTLLYLNSRGIDEKTARALLTKSKVQAVARFIPDQAVQEQIQQALEEALP